jgi:hypothetical protein
MLTEKDYCDYETCVALKELGYVDICDAYYELTGSEDYNRDSFELLYTRDFIHPDDRDRVAAPLLYQAQKWLREEKGIHIAPRIYLYHDINLDEQTSWECTIYVEWSAIYTIGKSLTYEDALLLGIKEAVKILKEKDGIS